MPQIETMPSQDLFRTTVMRSSDTVRVDRKENIIFGANLMQVGDLNEGDAREWTVDSKTLFQAQQFMSQSNNGAKARFTHPNMSSDGLGSYLGRWKNVIIDGDKLRGDLHLADAAFKSPQGDLATYVMDLAEEDPESFGVSLAPKLDHKDREAFKTKTKDDKWPIRFTGVRAGDVVDTPAATTGGFFSLTTIDNRNLPAQATALLTTYFGDAEPEVVKARIDGFLTTYFQGKGKVMPEQTAVVEQPKTIIAAEPLKTVDLSAERKAAADLAVKHERERITEIGSLCTQAKRPDLAAGFAEKGTSIEEVRKELFNVMCNSNKPVGDAGGSGDVQEADPDAKYKAEFKTEPRYAKSMSESDFVAMRRVDDGIDELKYSAAK